MVSSLGLQRFVMHLDEEQADRADWMAGLGLWMPHLIYGCMKCRVRFFHRQSELPRGNKKKSHGGCASACRWRKLWFLLWLVDV